MGENEDKTSLIPEREMKRIITFIVIQVFFLVVSPLAGGFHYKIWSMLDSAILVLSIGLTGLMLVVEQKKVRDLVFKIAVGLYILAVLDMSINILLSGWLGWEKLV